MKQLTKLLLLALTGITLNLMYGFKILNPCFAQCGGSAWNASTCNVALNKSATASGTPYWVCTPDKAFDGSMTGLANYWVMQGGAPGWIQVDLGQQYTIDNIQLVSVQSPDGNTVHEIYTSPDMSTWTLVETVSQYTCSLQVISRVYNPQLTSVQGVKIVTTNSAGSWVAWGEIEVNTCAVNLPIELLNFKATLIANKQVLLEWTTATETNNDYFTIEKTKDTRQYEIVGRVKGAGNSSSSLYYQLMDISPYQSISYYRLRQTDFDGKFFYSNIVPVCIGTLEIINIYPNPAEKAVTTKIAVQKNTEATIEVFNILGEQVIVQSASLRKGVTEVTIDTQALASGTYTFRITLPGKEHVQKMLVK